MDEKTALTDSYGLCADMLDFNLDDFSLEELKEKFEAMKTASQDPEDKDFALESQVRDELMQALEAEKVERGDDDWHYTIPRYWFFDYDKELMEVYGTSTEDYHIYGFQYSMNGDHAVIDWESKKRMKIALAAYNEGDALSPLERMFSAVEGDFRTGYTQLTEKYQTAEGDMDTMKAELDTLRKFKADAESVQQEAEAEKVFEKFEDLSGVEAFEALRGNAGSYSAEELEEKCFALRGRQATVAKFSKESKPPKLKVEKAHLEKEPYGGVFTEYGITAPGQGS